MIKWCSLSYYIYSLILTVPLMLLLSIARITSAENNYMEQEKGLVASFDLLTPLQVH